MWAHLAYKLLVLSFQGTQFLLLEGVELVLGFMVDMLNMIQV